MANRVPLIIDTSTLFFKELPVGDSLDLTGSGIVGVTSVSISGITTISVSSASTALTVIQSGVGTALYVDGRTQLTQVAITTTATDLTMETGYTYAFYSGTSTLTLPASPTAGDTLRIINRTGIATNTIIARNGSNIMGLADDAEFDLANETFNFTYANATDGWIISR